MNLVLQDEYAYVAVDSKGLLVLDISDPTALVEVGYCETPGSAINVVLSDGYAFLATKGSGLRIIDISDPAH